MASTDKPVIGFLGMGIMGLEMARRLLNSGKFGQVLVWNRTKSKCDELLQQGAVLGDTAADVVSKADITFAILADPAAAAAAVFSENGVLEGISAGKAYVDMSTVDEETSKKIGAAITAKGGLFLEAPVSGSKKPAIDGTLIILAAGDKALYDKCQVAFDIMGKKSFWLGEVGAGARMKLVVNMVMGSMMGAFCEGLALADKSGLKQTDLLEVLGLGALASPLLSLKGPAILAQQYGPAFPLKHQQKDMRLALELGEAVAQPLSVAAAANEQYRVAMEKGFADNDFCAVFEAVRAQA